MKCYPSLGKGTLSSPFPPIPLFAERAAMQPFGQACDAGADARAPGQALRDARKATGERYAAAEAQFTREKTKRYAPPKGDRADDGIRWAWFKSLPAEPQAREYEANQPLRETLLRYHAAGVHDRWAERADAEHRDAIDRRDPDGKRRLEQQETILEWAEYAGRHLNTKIEEATARQRIPAGMLFSQR